MPAYLPNLTSLDGLGGGYADAVHQRPQATRGAVYRRPSGGINSLMRDTTAVARANGSTAELQKFLVSRGYNIAVDGIRGPQTAAAVAAYHRGISPSRARIPAVRRYSPTGGGSRTTTRTVAPVRRYIAPRVSSGSRTIGVHTTPAQSGVAGTAPDASTGIDTSGGGDIQAQAEAMMAAKYDSQIAAIQRAMAAAQAQAEASAAATIKGYGEIGQVATQAAGQTQAANAQLANVEQTANQGMVNLFGGPGANGPAGEAAAFAGINQGELAQLASAQQAYDQQMPAVIGTQGQNAAAAIRQQAQAQIADMAGQLTDLQGQRGADLAQTVYQMQQDAADRAYKQQQDALQNQAAQQQLDLARQMAGPQLQRAQAEAKKAAFDANYAPTLARQQAKQFGVSIQRSQAELQYTRARVASIKKDLAGKNGQIDLTDPNTRTSLADRLRGAIQTKNGTWRMHPAMAMQNLNIALGQLNLANNPTARQIANSLLQETTLNSHAAKKWGQFNYANGKIVKTGKRFYPKKH